MHATPRVGEAVHTFMYFLVWGFGGLQIPVVQQTAVSPRALLQQGAHGFPSPLQEGDTFLAL